MLIKNFGQQPKIIQPSGIDRISVWIHPYLIRDDSRFHYRGNNNNHVNLRKEIYNGYSIDFQAEFFKPDDNIFMQIFNYLVILSVNGVLKYPPNKDRGTIEKCFTAIFNNLFAIDCVEFYFDFMINDLMLSEILEPRYTDSRYSVPFGKEKKSILISYSRSECAKKRNKLSYDEIASMPYPWRVEFRLKRRNCGYLHYENLFGNYDTVFHRYLSFMAKRWRAYGEQVAEIPCWNRLSYDDYFKQIVLRSRTQIKHFSHYLQKTPPCPMPNKSIKPKEVDRNWAVELSIGDWI